MQFFCYVDWTLEDVPRPFYVGKGKLDRVRSLIRNRHHGNIALSHGIRREIVLETDDEIKAFEEERRLIQIHKTYVYGGDGWWGANYTLGGEGVSGCRFVWSEQRRKHAADRQRESFKNPERIAVHVEATRKQWSNKMRKDRQRIRMKMQNPSHTHPDSAETKALKSKSQQQRFSNKKERQRLSDAVRLACQDPIVIERRCKAQRERRQREREERNK